MASPTVAMDLALQLPNKFSDLFHGLVCRGGHGKGTAQHPCGAHGNNFRHARFKSANAIVDLKKKKKSANAIVDLCGVRLSRPSGGQRNRFWAEYQPGFSRCPARRGNCQARAAAATTPQPARPKRNPPCLPARDGGPSCRSCSLLVPQRRNPLRYIKRNSASQKNITLASFPASTRTSSSSRLRNGIPSALQRRRQERRHQDRPLHPPCQHAGSGWQDLRRRPQGGRAAAARQGWCGSGDLRAGRQVLPRQVASNSQADKGAVSGVSWFAGTSLRPTSGAASGTKISAGVQAAITPRSAAKAAQISTFQAAGVSWIAGSYQKTLKALRPFPANHSASRLFSTKATEAAANPGKPPLGSFRVICALAGGTVGVLLCASIYDRLGILQQKPNVYKPVITAEDLEEDDLPDYVDWEEQGILTPVFDDDFGICWAIAPTHTVEGVFAQETGRVIQLSVQQVVDWGLNGGSLFVHGSKSIRIGFLHVTFEGIAESGLTSLEAYPMAPNPEANTKDREFELVGKPIIARIEGAEPIRNTERDFMRALQKSPIAVYMFADPNVMGSRYYNDDSVLTIQRCPPGKDVPVRDKVMSYVNHCAVLVGYGTDKITGRKYWKVKNSWGEDWGKGGYGRLERGGPDWRGPAGITSHWGYRPIISKQK